MILVRMDRWQAGALPAKAVLENSYAAHPVQMAWSTCAAVHCAVKACLPSLRAAREAQLAYRIAHKIPRPVLHHCHTLDISSLIPAPGLLWCPFACAMPHYYSLILPPLKSRGILPSTRGLAAYPHEQTVAVPCPEAFGEPKVSLLPCVPRYGSEPGSIRLIRALLRSNQTVRYDECASERLTNRIFTLLSRSVRTLAFSAELR